MDSSLEWETYDEYGAFGAFSVPDNDKKREEFGESLLDDGAILQRFIDDGTEENGNLENHRGNTPSSFAPVSNATPSAPPLLHLLDSPVETPYWSQLRPSIESSQLSPGARIEPSESPGLDDQLVLGYDWRNATLASIQVNARPRLVFPLSRTDEASNPPTTGVEAEEEVEDPLENLPELMDHSPSGSSSSGSPLLPITPLAEFRSIYHSLSGEPAVASVAPALLNDELRRNKGEENQSERVSDCSVSRDEERSAEATEERSTRVTSATEPTSSEVLGDAVDEVKESDDVQLPLPSPSPASVEMPDAEAEAFGAPEHVANEVSPEGDNEGPADLNLAPEAFSPAPSEAPEDLPTEMAFEQPAPALSKKRKRVNKVLTPKELKQRSAIPPETKTFNLRVVRGRASRSGKRPVEEMQLDAASCSHLAGTDGLCRFRLAGGEESCMAELPKNAEAVRMHFAMHRDELGWRQRSKRDPSWDPTCDWCGLVRTKYQELVRHILDTHLLVSADWCPCGGTNSRASQKSNRGRHENSVRHRAYLRKLAREEQGVEREDEDEEEDEDEIRRDEEEEEETEDEQPEFVQGSSKGTKRRRLR